MSSKILLHITLKGVESAIKKFGKTAVRNAQNPGRTLESKTLKKLMQRKKDDAIAAGAVGSVLGGSTLAFSLNELKNKIDRGN